MDHLNGEEFTGANVRYERSEDVPNSFKQSSREDMIKIFSYKA